MHTRRAFLGVIGAAAAAGAPDEPVWAGLDQAAAMVRQRRVSPVELTQACLRRIEALNPSLNAFITVTAETALSQARAAETEIAARRYRGPLHGIPVALKDLIDTAGVRTTAASAQYADRVPGEDADVVRRLKAAGAVLLGKTNLDEFAYNFTSETSYFGASKNPWNTRRSPGGSSGGSAIAAAAAMCFAALGSDTGGSIRLPAALCGIAGLKPSYGRVSTRGAAPLAWSLDHIGPMCRSARDAELVLAAISDAPATPPVKLSGVRVGVPRRTYFDQADAEVAAAVESAAKELGRITAGVRDVVLPVLPPYPEMPYLPLTYSTVIIAEAYAFHEEMLEQHPERYHAGTRRSIESGAAVRASDYIRARREMERLRAGSGVLFERADLLITPTALAPAFELGSGPTLVFLRNTAPWNLYGLPTISIPCGFSRGGLPIGLQITGPSGRDDLVLAAASAYQQATAWHTRRPLPPDRHAVG